MTNTADARVPEPSPADAYRWPAPGIETHGRMRFLEVFVCTALVCAAVAVYAGPMLLAVAFARSPVVSVVVVGILVLAAAVVLVRFRPWRFLRGRPAPTSGETRGVLGRTVGRHTPVLGMAGLAGAVVLVLFLRLGAPLTAIVAASAADAVLLVWATRVVWQGGVAVRWLPETLVPGGRATFLVETTPGGSRLTGCRVMLRLTGPSGDLLWSRVVAPDHDPGPEEAVIVHVDLPPDAPAAVPPFEWDLIVQGRTMWGVVRESFLVPVGTCPPAPVAAPPL